MARLSTMMVWTVLGALAWAPVAAQAQTAGDPTGGRIGYTRTQTHVPGQQRLADLPAEIGRPVLVPVPPAEQAQAGPDDQAQAQAPAQPGQVRVQGRPLEEPAAPLPVPTGILLDMRQQMRQFVQNISVFARSHSRNFMVVTNGGLELLIKRDPVDETRFAPSRSYIRSIDGVMIDGLFFDKRVFGEPPPAERQAVNLRLTDIAKANGVKVFVVDYGSDPKTVDESRRLNREKGYVSTAVPAPLAELTRLPPYPPRPFGENPKSILSLKDVSNFAYIADSSAFGRPEEFALRMHGNNYDLLIVDILHGREPLSRRAVETLKFKKLGARRLVFARVNIGTAESFRYYWKSTWREGSPLWIAAPVRDDPDRYFVQFWRPEWQRIISGDTQSYVYGLIFQGFDGVILEGVEEAYRFFEGGGEQEQEETPVAETPAPAQPETPAPAAAQPLPPQ